MAPSKSVAPPRRFARIFQQIRYRTMAFDEIKPSSSLSHVDRFCFVPCIGAAHPVMQGAGPLTTPTGRWLARRVLTLVDAALLRDRGSFELVAGLAKPEKLVPMTASSCQDFRR